MSSIGSLDIGGMMLATASGRARTLEQAITELMSEIQRQKGEMTLVATIVHKLVAGGNLDPREYQFLAANGIQPAPRNRGQMLQKLNALMSSLKASSEGNMIRLQALMNQHNQALEMISNLMSKMAQQQQSVIGNLR